MDRRMEQVEVNVTDDGMVEITQSDMGHDDTIRLHPSQIPALCEFLKAAADEAANDRAEAGRQ